QPLVVTKMRRITRNLLSNFLLAFLAALALCMPISLGAQETIEWTTLGNDFAHTRSTPANQISPENFADLE